MEATEYVEQYLERAQRKAEKYPALWIPRERVAPIVQDWKDKHEREAVGPFWAKIPAGEREKLAASTKILAERAGVTERAIWRLLCEDIRVKPKKWQNRPSWSSWMVDGGAPYLSVDLVERLFIAMGREYLWYLDPEDGGFSDIYWAEAA